MSSDMFPDSFIKYALEKEGHMADHGQNDNPPQEHVQYESEESPAKLGGECGHHCGIITVGAATSHERHCNCRECHGDPVGLSRVIATSNNGARPVDPRTIT